MDIDIRPQVNILGVLRHLNYKPWFALAEFVDNSLASAQRHGLMTREAPLRVFIDLDPEDGGRLVIRDNAAGIAASEFPRAFRAAEPPPDRSGLAEFGMGMKSAASWFAQEWMVTTSVAGEPIERSVHFDLKEIAANNQAKIQVVEAAARAEAHYTTVQLTKLNHLPKTKTLNKIREHLSSIYRIFLRDGILVLVFRGEELNFQDVPILVAPPAGDPDRTPINWRKSIDIDLDGDRKVTGFAAIRERGSTSEAGFALFRRGRLIIGGADETYRPPEVFGRSTTYTYQRLFGELTLHGFGVSHTKDGFQWDDQEDAFVEALIDELRSGDCDLLAQASNYRAKDARDLVPPVTKAISEVAHQVEQRFDPDVTTSGETDDQPLPDTLKARPLRPIHREVVVNLSSETWRIDLEATLDDAIPDWLGVGAETTGPASRGHMPEARVKITVSLSYPFSQKFLGASNENTELLMTMGVVVGLALALGKRNGAKSQSIVNRINRLARETFAFVEPQEGVK